MLLYKNIIELLNKSIITNQIINQFQSLFIWNEIIIFALKLNMQMFIVLLHRDGGQWFFILFYL